MESAISAKKQTSHPTRSNQGQLRRSSDSHGVERTAIITSSPCPGRSTAWTQTGRATDHRGTRPPPWTTARARGCYRAAISHRPRLPAGRPESWRNSESLEHSSAKGGKRKQGREEGERGRHQPGKISKRAGWEETGGGGGGVGGGRGGGEGWGSGRKMGHGYMSQVKPMCRFLIFTTQQAMRPPRRLVWAPRRKTVLRSVLECSSECNAYCRRVLRQPGGKRVQVE